MAEFGWAYIGDGAITGSAGATGSVQFKIGNQAISGSDRFIFYTASNRLHLSGTFTVSGAISASNYIIDNIHVIDSSGSTSFGETNDDIHVRTGSLIAASASNGAGSAGTTIFSASISSTAGSSFVYAHKMTINKTPRGFEPSASLEWNAVASGSSLFLDSALRVSGGVTLGDGSGDVITIVGTTTSSAEALYSNNVQIADDKKLYFGDGRDASIEYDEDGVDAAILGGTDWLLPDDKKLYFGVGKDASFEYDEDGTDTLLYAGASLRFTDDVKLEFGTGGSSSIEFNGNGDDYLVISGTTSGIALSGTNLVMDGAVTLKGNITLGNAATDVVTSTAQFTASQGGTFGEIVSIDDDKKLYFGTGRDAYIEYDEAGNDYINISGSAEGIALSGTNIQVDAQNFYLKNSISARPRLYIQDENADANAGQLIFNKTSSSPANNDVIGSVVFSSYDAGGGATVYGSMVGEIKTFAAGGERGRIKFNVAEYDGTLTEGLTLQGASTDGQVDITVPAVSYTHLTLPTIYSV